jgi:drug/metabolite transporter (DMT)-like permease
MALTPVLVLPAVILRRRERVTLRAAAGAALAVAGTAVLLT